MERELKQIMRYYYEDKERVLQSLDSCGQGLSDAEAAARLERNGRNKLKEAKKESLLSRFFNQLKDPMIIILIAAAIVSGVVSVVEKESFSDTIIIIAVVLLNAVLGVYQESKAEKSDRGIAGDVLGNKQGSARGAWFALSRAKNLLSEMLCCLKRATRCQRMRELSNAQACRRRKPH